VLSDVSCINLTFIHLFKNRYEKIFKDFTGICAEKDTRSWLKSNLKVKIQNYVCGVGMLHHPKQWQAITGSADQFPES